jgi:Holliday junction resolvasome RuvABC endonuclease subunit
MNRQVIGLDLSLRHTGIAYPDGTTLVVDGTKERGPQRWATIYDTIAMNLWCAGGSLHLAVIEGYAYAAAGRALFDLCELGGLIRWELHRRAVPWLVVPPTTLKKYATGKGQATKTEMVIAARERLGYTGTDDNEADALWLRAVGLDLLDEPPCALPKVNRKVLDRLTWPVGVDTDALR